MTRRSARGTIGAVTTATAPSPIGDLLRDWRRRRRLSQLDLALAAGVSARHVSFVETGRSRPSRSMVLQLAEQLDVPPRDRNRLLLAAGFAPSYTERALDDPEMTPVRHAVELVLAGYEPYPALVVDRGWHLVAANAAAGAFVAGVAEHLLAPPVNVLRLSLHPDGLARRIGNLGQWRAHVLDRLAREAALTASDELAALHAELLGYPGGLDRADEPDGRSTPPTPAADTGVFVPLRLHGPDGELVFLSTVTTFGTAVDVTAAELSIEAFLPADEATAAALRATG